MIATPIARGQDMLATPSPVAAPATAAASSVIAIRVGLPLKPMIVIGASPLRAMRRRPRGAAAVRSHALIDQIRDAIADAADEHAAENRGRDPHPRYRGTEPSGDASGE